MFNRFGLIIISVVSIVIITIVGYSLISQSEKLSIENVFDESDKKILILNAISKDIDFYSDTELSHNINIEKVSKIKEQKFIKRIAFSEKNQRILIEGKYHFSINDVQTILKNSGFKILKSDNKDYELSENSFAQHKLDKIYIYQNRPENILENLPNWDVNSDYSIIDLKKKNELTDVYFKTDNQIQYNTKLVKGFQSRKVDDKELFGEFIPSNITSYHFYEKEFALNNHFYKKESPLYNWLDYGFVEFTFNGEKCIISDYKENQNPILILNDLLKIGDTITVEKTYYKNIVLGKGFPKNDRSGFYVYKLGDKVIIANSEHVLKQILAEHQIGKTLSLNNVKSEFIYGSLPQKVSERKVDFKQKFTTTIYNNIAIKTVLNALNSTITKVDEEKTSAEEVSEDISWTQTIDSDVVETFKKGRRLFVLTSNNKLIGLDKQKVVFSRQLDGNVLGRIMYQNQIPSHPILITTNKYIYLINEFGEILGNNPIAAKAEFLTPANVFIYKNAPRIVVVEQNTFYQYDAKCNLLGKFSVNANAKSSFPVLAFKQNKRNVAVVQNGNRSASYDIDKQRIIKNYDKAHAENVMYVDAEIPYAFGLNDKSLFKQDYNTNMTILGNYPSAKMYKKIGLTQFAFEAYGKIHVYNNQGVKLHQFEIPFTDFSDFDVITLSNGKVYYAVVDAIENDVYLFDQKGNKINEKPLEGKNLVCLNEYEANKILITSAGNNFLVQYWDILK